jgi:hypothetical protein
LHYKRKNFEKAKEENMGGAACLGNESGGSLAKRDEKEKNAFHRGKRRLSIGLQNMKRSQSGFAIS